MQKKFKEKYNDGCIKIFELLKLLYEDEAYYDNVMQIFSDEYKDTDGKETDIKKRHVILNKYLNTLKVFGVKITKIKNKFVMHNGPFSLNFDMDDIKSVELLKKLYDFLPNGKSKNNLGSFLKTVESRLDYKSKLYLSTISTTDNVDFSFFYSPVREQIEKCEQICQENFRVSVKYLEKDKEKICTGNAQQILYDCKKAYLRVFKMISREVCDIAITDILSIEQLPNIKNNIEMTTSVVYTIKGRLANAYQLKENEYLRETLSDGSLVIVNTNEPFDKLIRRLIRYDYECKINTPKFLQTQMVEMINDTLKNYKE